MEFTNEQIIKAKNCKTLDEFKALLKEEGVNLSEEQVEECYAATRIGELTDDELAAVAGGKKGKPKFDIGDWVRIKGVDPHKDPRLFEGRVWSRNYTNKRWMYEIRQSGSWTRNEEESRLILVKKYNE